jgi:REP element-mobilizing transposase RayT
VPIYLFTFHAYRSWRPDHPRGYVRRNEGVLPRDPDMAGRYDRHAKFPQVRFTSDLQRVLVDGAQDICSRRAWRLHFVATDPTHVHLLISWLDRALGWKDVHDTLKRLLGMLLAKHTGERGRKWFVRKGSRRRVRDREHFEYLMGCYLPSHRGFVWSERNVASSGIDETEEE